MTERSDCHAVRPLLFALDEGEVTAHERVELTAHLAVCGSCRGFLDAERQLTGQLRSPQTAGQRRRLHLRGRGALIAAAALALVVLVPMFAGSAEAYGSIVQDRLDSTVSWQSEASRPLQARNRVDLEAGVKATLEVEDVGVLRATGPAVFELDRTQDDWKLTLLRGSVAVMLEAEAALTVSSVHGRRRLTRGQHRISLDAASFRPQAVTPPSGVVTLAAALEAFSAGGAKGKEGMAQAERKLAAVLERSETTPRDREIALFYLWCAQLNQGKAAAALQSSDAWLRKYADPGRREYVLAGRVSIFVVLQRAGAARKALQDLQRAFPASKRITSLKGLVERLEPTRRHKSRPESSGTRPAVRSDYLVIATALDRPGPRRQAFRRVAQQVARHHGGRVASWDGKDFASLRATLLQSKPRNLLFVLEPETLDVNLHRSLLGVVSGLDDDLFVDCPFGYFTARGAGALRRLWKRTLERHKRGAGEKRWVGTAVTSSERPSWFSKGAIPEVARAAGFQGGRYYFTEQGRDPRVSRFVDENLRSLQDADVIAMSGNGDPQGIWLFSGERNRRRDLHWPFDPKKVGHDPEGEMTRILAPRFRKLRLDAPVLWSGTCHSGATHRVYVEGDIVSTFGRSDTTALYRMPAEESLALAWIDAGATALLVPIAANHGMSAMREQVFALREGASLGEAIASTWNDVLLQARGKLSLSQFSEGERHRRRAPIMQGGGANRILIGDPALRLFAATPHPKEKVVVEKATDLTRVVVTWEKGFHSWGWDMFGTDRSRDWRVFLRLPWTGDRAPKEATVKLADAAGKEIPSTLTHAVVEKDGNRRWLHLQANGPRDRMSYEFVEATFTLR